MEKDASLIPFRMAFTILNSALSRALDSAPKALIVAIPFRLSTIQECFSASAEALALIIF